MPIKEFCVYNETRESFLSSRVSVIDTRSDPLNLLKVLMEGPSPNEETGLWLNPLKSVPMVPRLSSYDLVYLDQDCKVVHGVALVPDAEVPSFSGQAASALLLPFRSFASSQTHPGDQVVIRAAEEMEHISAPVPVPATPAPAPPDATVWADQSSTPLGTHAPLWGASFGQPQAAMQQFDAKEIVQSLGRKSDSSKFRSWRALARLRVHISISVAPAPVAKTPPLRAERGTAQSVSLRTRCEGRSRELMHQYGRPSISSCSTWVAHCTHSLTQRLTRKYGIWKVEYQRWAEEFIYGPERVAARTAVPGAQGAELQVPEEGR